MAGSLRGTMVTLRMNNGKTILCQILDGNLKNKRWWRTISCQMSNLGPQTLEAIKEEIWNDSLAMTRSKSVA